MLSARFTNKETLIHHLCHDYLTAATWFHCHDHKPVDEFIKFQFVFT